MVIRMVFGALVLVVLLSFISTVGIKKAQALNGGTVTTRASTAGNPLR